MIKTRRYRQGAWLATHTDRLSTHVISAIIHVGHKVLVMVMVMTMMVMTMMVMVMAMMVQKLQTIQSIPPMMPISTNNDNVNASNIYNQLYKAYFREKIGHFTLLAPLVEKLVRFFLNRVRFDSFLNNPANLSRFFGMNPPGYLMEDPSLSRGRLMTMFLSISSRVAGVGTGEGKLDLKLGENVQGWRGKVGCGAKAKVEGCAEGGAGD